MMITELHVNISHSFDVSCIDRFYKHRNNNKLNSLLISGKDKRNQSNNDSKLYFRFFDCNYLRYLMKLSLICIEIVFDETEKFIDFGLELDDLTIENIVVYNLLHQRSSDCFISFVNLYKNVKSLSISNCCDMNDKEINSIFNHHSSSVKIMNISKCLSIESPMILSQKLEYLDISFCMNIHLLLPVFDTIAFELRHCDVSYTNVNSKVIELILKYSMKLSTLVGKCLNRLSSLTLKSNSLKNVEISSSKNLQSLHIECPLLLQLKIDHSESLKRLYVKSFYLESLDVCGLTNLEAIKLFCVNLSTFKAMNCLKLGKSHFESSDSSQSQPDITFLDIVGNCPMLTRNGDILSDNLRGSGLFDCHKLYCNEEKYEKKCNQHYFHHRSASL